MIFDNLASPGVPNDWSIKTIEELIVEIGDGGTPPRDDSSNFGGDIAWAVIEDIKKDIKVTREHLTIRGVHNSNAKIWPVGSVIVSTGATIGRVGIARVPLATKQGITGIVPDSERVCSDYLAAVLLSGTNTLERFAQGSTFMEIRPPTLKKLRMLVPSIREQSLITSAMTTMDDTIAKAEALIAKLKQVRAGLLHDLLTRGLDEHGQLRPPPAEAPHHYADSPLGIIPREWKVGSVGSFSGYVTSGSRGWASYYASDGPLFIRIGNLTREHINLRFDDVVHVEPPSGGEGARTRTRGNDILVSITADLGIIGVVPATLGEAYVNQHIALVRPSAGVVSQWLGRYLASGPPSRTFMMLNDSGAKAGLNLQAIQSIVIAMPEETEQAQVAAILDSADGVIVHEEREAMKLRSLKSGLMADLLTGRVRVPENIAFTEACP